MESKCYMKRRGNVEKKTLSNEICNMQNERKSEKEYTKEKYPPIGTVYHVARDVLSYTR